jgi:hypothetical protein
MGCVCPLQTNTMYDTGAIRWSKLCSSEGFMETSVPFFTYLCNIIRFFKELYILLRWRHVVRQKNIILYGINSSKASEMKFGTLLQEIIIDFCTHFC